MDVSSLVYEKKVLNLGGEGSSCNETSLALVRSEGSRHTTKQDVVCRSLDQLSIGILHKVINHPDLAAKPALKAQIGTFRDRDERFILQSPSIPCSEERRKEPIKTETISHNYLADKWWDKDDRWIPLEWALVMDSTTNFLLQDTSTPRSGFTCAAASRRAKLTRRGSQCESRDDLAIGNERGDFLLLGKRRARWVSDCH